MQKIFAMLFAVTLLASQAISLAQVREVSRPATSACCAHPATCKMQCCVEDPADSAPHAPANPLPARGLTQNDLQILAAVTVKILPATATTPPAFSSAVSILPAVTAPLYQRNCSYLI